MMSHFFYVTGVFFTNICENFCCISFAMVVQRNLRSVSQNSWTFVLQMLNFFRLVISEKSSNVQNCGGLCNNRKLNFSLEPFLICGQELYMTPIFFFALLPLTGYNLTGYKLKLVLSLHEQVTASEI
jgi:hypothetical protein